MKKLAILVILTLLVGSTLVAAGLWDKLTGATSAPRPKMSFWAKILNLGKYNEPAEEEVVQPVVQTQVNQDIVAIDMESLATDKFLEVLDGCFYTNDGTQMCCGLPGASSPVPFDPNDVITGNAAASAPEPKDRLSFEEIKALLANCDIEERVLCCTMPEGVIVNP